MDRIATGIEALDVILQGGIPSGASVLIAGSPGTGKTILSSQIIFNNASENSKVLYLTTMSEPQAKIIKFQNEFSYFDIEKFQTSVFYYDISSFISVDGAKKLLTLIDGLMRKHEPKLVVIDTIKVLDDIISSCYDMREFILSLSMKLAVWDCTTLFLGEYAEGHIGTRPESAIMDGIILLSGTEEKKYQKRFMRILKMRGTNYDQGEIYFKITSDGVSLYPRLHPDTKNQPYNRDFTQRVSSGVQELDKMIGGGLPKGTVTLMSGGAGTGKTIMALHFAYSGLLNGESVMYVTFEENPNQLVNSALSAGVDVRPYIEDGQLTLLHVSPIELDMDEHIFVIQDHVRRFNIGRVIIDSISSFELGVNDKIKYTDYIFMLTNYLKTMGVTTYLTHELHNSFSLTEFTKHGISFVADNLILMETKEFECEIKRYIRIVKARSCNHELNLREFSITDHGIVIKCEKNNSER